MLNIIQRSVDPIQTPEPEEVNRLTLIADFVSGKQSSAGGFAALSSRNYLTQYEMQQLKESTQLKQNSVSQNSSLSNINNSKMVRSHFTSQMSHSPFDLQRRKPAK